MAPRRLPCCVVLVVAFCHLDLPVHAQSLVDAARLARDTREQLGPPAKVYTNADLPEAGRVTGPTPARVSQYRSLLEAALRRERALLELLRERRVTQRPLAARSVRPDPAPSTAPATGGSPCISPTRATPCISPTRATPCQWRDGSQDDGIRSRSGICTGPAGRTGELEPRQHHGKPAPIASDRDRAGARQAGARRAGTGYEQSSRAPDFPCPA